MTSILKKAKVSGAVAAALAAGLAAQPALAVNHSDDGLGEVVMIPYYTARNGYDTYVSIVNTSPDYVIAVKIRMRERDNTRDARDFNIFLSPNDVWAAVITMNAQGVPVIQTPDNTCTDPALPAGQATVAGLTGVTFTSSAYDGSAESIWPADGGSTGIERTYDGHIEIIEMGASLATNPIASLAVHNPATGVPNCDALRAALPPSTYSDAIAEFGEPINVMKGSAYLLNMGAGIGATIPVDTLANFANEDDILALPSDPEPNLRSVDPQITQRIAEIGGVSTLVQDDFTTNAEQADAISSLFMATSVLNEYAVGGGNNVLNDWVITFPTKNFYVDTLEQPAAPVPPFENVFQPDGLSCESVTYNYFDREERAVTPTTGTDFSPRPEGQPGASICQETNLLVFGQSSALAGADIVAAGNAYAVPRNAGFDSGWMRLTFTGAPATNIGISGTNFTYYGLPVTGFGIKTYQSGVAAANYGVAQEHAYSRSVMANP
ncbi:hypothetical protein [Rhabdochromatium marinum]|uniref:hypothetical protein n=1 Tax=Rhabdochromatium marinum TaxID=48729 RepID=UPI00190618BA|nr:hypothetical protein [Rhabdochromatium marinum]MBK1647792.1 hypothetical protein [Rhabdochromatium marinum]